MPAKNKSSRAKSGSRKTVTKKKSPRTLKKATKKAAAPKKAAKKKAAKAPSAGSSSSKKAAAPRKTAAAKKPAAKKKPAVAKPVAAKQARATKPAATTPRKSKRNQTGLLPFAEGALRTVAEIMTTPVVTCTPQATLAEAAFLMWRHDCGVLPVVSAEDTLEGMVTDRDLCMSAAIEGSSMHELGVAAAMTAVVSTCHPMDRLTVVHERLRQHQVHRLPVVDDEGQVLGLVTLADLATAAVAHGKPAGLRDVAQTLGRVRTPRDGLDPEAAMGGGDLEVEVDAEAAG